MFSQRCRLLFQLKVVRGPIGTSSLKFLIHNYGSITMSLDDPRPGVLVPAHSLRSLNATFDTLAIDCDWVLVETTKVVSLSCNNRESMT